MLRRTARTRNTRSKEHEPAGSIGKVRRKIQKISMPVGGWRSLGGLDSYRSAHKRLAIEEPGGYGRRRCMHPAVADETGPPRPCHALRVREAGRRTSALAEAAVEAATDQRRRVRDPTASGPVKSNHRCPASVVGLAQRMRPGRQPPRSPSSAPPRLGRGLTPPRAWSRAGNALAGRRSFAGRARCVAPGGPEAGRPPPPWPWGWRGA